MKENRQRSRQLRWNNTMRDDGPVVPSELVSNNSRRCRGNARLTCKRHQNGVMRPSPGLTVVMRIITYYDRKRPYVTTASRDPNTILFTSAPANERQAAVVLWANYDMFHETSSNGDFVHYNDSPKEANDAHDFAGWISLKKPCWRFCRDEVTYEDWGFNSSSGCRLGTYLGRMQKRTNSAVNG